MLAHGVLRERHRRWVTWSLPGLIFWGTYTDWLFVPLCAVILIYRLRHHRDIRAISPAFVRQVALPATLAIICFLLQLFWVLGPPFVSALLERFLVRSMDTGGAFERHESLLWYGYGHFVASMGGLTIALTGLALLLLCVRPRMIASPLKDFLMLLSVPSVLLLLIFRQHSAVHQFTTVKFMIPICILLGGILPGPLSFHISKVFLLCCVAFFCCMRGGNTGSQ